MGKRLLLGGDTLNADANNLSQVGEFIQSIDKISVSVSGAVKYDAYDVDDTGNFTDGVRNIVTYKNKAHHREALGAMISPSMPPSINPNALTSPVSIVQVFMILKYIVDNAIFMDIAGEQAQDEFIAFRDPRTQSVALGETIVALVT